MANTDVLPAIPTSFVYEDLVEQVQAIQNQPIEFENIPAERWQNNKDMRKELKFHSCTFIDPYGNEMIEEHIDHEATNSIVRKYLKN
ncbi:hypothetical protein I4U23_011575 [Adineta vaga]|nr:hypothetical protein I4U23_011575 [Adineta vaga]